MVQTGSTRQIACELEKTKIRCSPLLALHSSFSIIRLFLPFPGIDGEEQNKFCQKIAQLSQ